ncbi:MAG: carboxypeptidase-like regulatory domain-containing protein [Acidobacteriaceae bacterium]
MKFPSFRILLASVFFFCLVICGLPAWAQTTTSVTGLVTDPTGAVIPDATVVLSNPSRGLTFTVKTDSAGSYRVPNVPPGPGYQIQVSSTGFSSYEEKNFYVNVAAANTQNATLKPGTATTQVRVAASAQGVTINTTDASVGNNFQVSKLNDLPVQVRTSPAILFVLQPGITITGATTGARVDQTDTTVDGLDVNDFATGNFAAITANAPVDSVQEFRGTTAGFTADSGPGGGGQFQLVTRSGTNEWHGNVSEYHRDNSTVANDWFNDEEKIPAPKLVRNQFGGALGGPIKHDKLFFFFDFLGSRVAQEASALRNVPLSSLAAGKVAYINDNSGCGAGSRQNTTPNCISYLTPAQVAAFDPAGIGDSPQVLSVFKIYPAPNDLTQGDGVNSGGFRFNAPTPDDLTNYVGRMDWVLTPKIHLYGRGTVARENAVETVAQFPGDQPAGTFVDRSYAYVGGMDWQISNNKFNQLIYGSTVQDYSFPRPSNPENLYQYGFAGGTYTLLDSPYSSPTNAQARRVPIPEVSDNFTWTVGRHNLQMGGYFKWILAHDQTTLGYNSYAIGLGGEIQGLTNALRPANILPANSTAQVTYDSAFTTVLGRVGELSSTFNYNAAGQALAQPSTTVQDFQYYQTQPYFLDSWKVTPSLTITYGVNYQYFSVPYEIHGLESVQNMGFDQYFDARLKQSAAGISGPNVLPFFTYVLGGKANHAPGFYKNSPHEFAPRFAFAYTPSFDPNTVFNGSAGIVYDRTIINAVQYQQTQYSYLFEQNSNVPYGVGTDPAGSLANVAANPRLSNPPLATPPPSPKTPYTPYVSSGIPYGLQNGAAFNEMIDPNLKDPYSILINVGMQHQFPGSTILKINYVGRLGRRLLAQADSNQLIDFPDKKSGQLMSQAMGNITKELRAGANPANLPAEPWWENQLPAGIGVANGFPNNSSFVAYELQTLVQKGDFADTIQALSGLLNYNVGMGAQFSENTMYTNKGFSSYNGMLVTVNKNLTHGLQFDFNYTWSHSIDNVSVIANAPAVGGYGFICDATNLRECRGNSDFDVTNYITSDFTYSLPFGRGRQFAGNVPWWMDELVGGWNLSGIPSWHTGQAYTTVASAYVAGYANDAPGILVGPKSALIHHQHKDSSGAMQLYADPAAAAAAFTGPVGLKIGNRNILRGPNFFNIDAGLAKNFVLVPSRNVTLQFRADAFNVLNHPNFDQLDYDNYSSYIDITQPSIFGTLPALVSNPATGGPNAIGAPRVVQISGRIQF